MPLTRKDAAALRRTLAIDDSVLADMRAAAAVLQPLVPTLVDEFYEWIEPTSELGAHFAVDPTLVERARREQTEYWQQFLAARRDESYVSQRRAVARLHARRELGLPIYLRALAFARRWLLRRLEAEEALWRERPSLAESIRKLIHFEVVVIVNGYVERTAELLEEERGRVQRVAAVMRAFAHGELARDIEASTDARVSGWLDGLLECLEVSAGVPDGAMVEGSGASEGDELGELLRAITQMVRREEGRHDVRLQRLLTMSRAQAEELTTRQRQLAAANEQLERLMRALESQKDALLGTESELRRKASELEKTSHRKSEFIANMSHELRTPLNATMVLARVLAENPEENLSPRQVEYARSIYSAGADLLALIDDILDLSKIEAGIVDLNIEPVPIEELLHELERRFRPLAEDSGLELAVALEQGLPPAIETDRQRLQQLLTNLLANALKYAEEGSVRIVASPRGSNHVAFAVEDTGPGIDPAHHESIFTPFHRASGKSDGTGLGLAIVRELVELLGGELRLKSAPGDGSVFTVLLPRAYVEPPDLEGARVTRSSAPPPAARETVRLPEPAPVPRPCPSAQGDSCRVLLVEDDVRTVFALTGLLEARGVELTTARNGREGLERLAQGPPFDLVLMDIEMPEMDGLTATRTIRAGDTQPDVPIIAFTARAHPRDRDQCLAAGANAYLSKPVDIDALLASMQEALRR